MGETPTHQLVNGPKKCHDHYNPNNTLYIDAYTEEHCILCQRI